MSDSPDEVITPEDLEAKKCSHVRFRYLPDDHLKQCIIRDRVEERRKQGEEKTEREKLLDEVKKFKEENPEDAAMFKNDEDLIPLIALLKKEKARQEEIKNKLLASGNTAAPQPTLVSKLIKTLGFMFNVNIIVLLAFITMFGVIIYASLFANPYTPIGSVGYIVEKPVWGGATFYGLQIGPASPGWSTDLYVINVALDKKTLIGTIATSMRLKDSATIDYFCYEIMYKVRKDKVKEFVEAWVYDSSYSGTYNIRTGEFRQSAFLSMVDPCVLIEFYKFTAAELKSDYKPLEQQILKSVKELFKDEPFEILDFRAIKIYGDNYVKK